MPENTQTDIPQPDAAYDTLYRQLHAPAFFQKLASYGIEPTTEKEATELLTLAGRLKLVDQSGGSQGAGGSRFSKAASDLDTLLSQRGLDGGIKSAEAQERNASRRKTAEQIAGDADIYNSVLSLKAAQAQQLVSGQGGQAQR